MGRNQDLRRKIAGIHRRIDQHNAKIRLEVMKSHPDAGTIAHWKAEIGGLKKRVALLTRRLKRKW